MINTLDWIQWNGLRGLQIENEFIRVIIIPSYGAKFVSLFNKLTNHEWLVQPQKILPAVLPNHASFHEWSMFGWDEMFPTILSCPYPFQGKYYKRLLEDHGEVWSQEWGDETQNKEEVIFSARSINLPLRITRKLSFYKKDTLLFKYEIHNMDKEDLAYIWAPHPFFFCEPGDEILLPEEVKEVCNVMEKEQWGKSGTIFKWPKAISMNGEEKNINIIGQPKLHAHSKFYVSPKTQIEWAGICRKKNHESIILKWSAKDIRYCGLVIDEGYSGNYSRVSIEPCKGFYDSLEIAYLNEKYSLIPAGQFHRWELFVHLVNQDNASFFQKEIMKE